MKRRRNNGSYLVQIHEGEQPKKLTYGGWALWTNCRSMDECRSMALDRHIRNRGGIGSPFTVCVYIVKPSDVQPGKMPPVAHVTEYRVSPKWEELPKPPYRPSWARDRLKGASGDW